MSKLKIANRKLGAVNLGKILVYSILIIFSISFAFADAEKFAEAKKLIDAKTPCSKLTENQLEIIGDYLMEQMHPEQAHEAMDKVMGGESSESLRQMHIAMAKRIHCNDISGMVNYGMMGMMGMMMGSGISNGGMMSMMGYNFGYGMIGNVGYWSFVNLLSLILVIGLIILVYLWIIKLWKEISKKK